MDLSRAKWVLIVAFLGLNIFLLYQIIIEEGMDNPVLFGRKEEVSRLETALQQANLSLDTSLPRGGISVAYLVVMPWQPDAEDVAAMLWQGLENEEDDNDFSPDNLVIKDDPENNIRSWRFGSYELRLCKEGTFQLQHAFKGLEPEQKEEAAEEFMKRVSFLQDFVYDYIIAEQDKTVLYYRQDYGDFPLYAGYVQFYSNGEPDSKVHFYRLEPLGFGEQQREVIPPSTALWRFLEAYLETEQDVLPTAIVEFSLGYYGEEYDAERWEIPPVWRIRLLNGEVFYINAFTGYLEN